MQTPLQFHAHTATDPRRTSTAALLRRLGFSSAIVFLLACTANAQEQPGTQDQAQEQAQEQVQIQDQPGSAPGDRNLNLFQPVEQANRPETSSPQPMRPVAPPDTPVFQLVGTSRFGDNYSARVRTAAGEVITVRAAPGRDAEIPGHPGYRVTDLGSRSVAVRYPGNVPCVEFPDKGVSCEGANNTARLQVATAAAIVPPEPERQQRRRRGADNAEAEAAQENPFAAALRAARERNPEDEAVIRAQAERFERRRINPEDVPEGARVVRTPFGDRIVRPQD